MKEGGNTLQVDKLEDAGVKKVVCIAVAEPEEVSKWADKVGLTGTKIEVWADTKGAWTRMLGLDVNQYDEPGPRSHRCSTAHVPNVKIIRCFCIIAHDQRPVICHCCPAVLGIARAVLHAAGARVSTLHHLQKTITDQLLLAAGQDKFLSLCLVSSNGILEGGQSMSVVPDLLPDAGMRP